MKGPGGRPRVFALVKLEGGLIATRRGIAQWLRTFRPVGTGLIRVMGRSQRLSRGTGRLGTTGGPSRRHWQ